MPEASEKHDIDELLKKMEHTIEHWLGNLSGWVKEGEELLARSRQWLDEHPLSKEVTQQAVRRTRLDQLHIPVSFDEARDQAQQASAQVRRLTRRSRHYAQAHPLQVVLVAAGLAAAAAWVMQSRTQPS